MVTIAVILAWSDYLRPRVMADRQKRGKGQYFEISEVLYILFSSSFFFSYHVSSLVIVCLRLLAGIYIRNVLHTNSCGFVISKGIRVTRS